MVGGIVLLAAFTSVLTATLTAEQVTGKIHGPRDLTGRTVGCVETAVTVQIIRQRGGVPREFPTMSGALDALSTGFVDAVVGENQQLMYLTNQPDRQGIKLVGPIFESFDYGLGLPNGSPLREPLNMAIGPNRRGLLESRYATTDGFVIPDKKPRVETRGHRVVGRSRICMSDGSVCTPGVPRLPPRASSRGHHVRQRVPSPAWQARRR